ncbi:MAG: hypothetical protein ACI3W5_17685 [Faecousia sp.]
MKRDFSESARQELLSLVKQVEDEQWCDFTDWVGDRWYDFEGWIGQLDIRKYVDNVNSYHKKVIDKNDASADEINKIFEAVNTQSVNYRGRFLAILTDLQSFRQLLTTISNVVAPGNGQFDPVYIGTGLKDAVNTYLENSELLQKISGDGLNSEDLDEVQDQDQLQRLLDAMGSTLIALVPDVGVGQKVEIPIGPDLTFYYAVDAEIDSASNVDINMVIEDQRVKIDNISAETGGMLSIGTECNMDGDGKISVSSDNSSVSFDYTGTLEGSGTVTIGNNTYTVTIIASPDKLVLEESVTTEVEGGSVTTKIGIEKKNNSSWKAVPVPVPIEVPYPGVLPDIEIDWEAVGTVVVVATAVYTVIYIGTAVYTGGGSLVVLPPPIPA